MCMVVLNHVADYFVIAQVTNTDTWKHIGDTYLFEAISHCAIPLFLMLTGVYAIEKASKPSPYEFYKSSAKKLGIPFLLFVIIYYVFDICITKRKTINTIFVGIATGFQGMYAHWYMVLLTVIYAFVPLLAFIKNKTSQVAWEKEIFIFFIWTMLSFHYGNSLAAWSLSNMYLLGYVLLGNVIH